MSERPDAPEYIIETVGLTKTFGSIQAVNDLSFSIGRGEIYGFLGQNGAGKSTTMRMLLGLIRPDKGSVKVNGETFKPGKQHLLRHIGAIIERPDLYGYLSGWDNLQMFARLSGEKISVDHLNYLLELVKLKGREGDKVKAYSQGMKQRLGIAIALVHSPDMLILDEPTNGLDPQGIAEMRHLITHLSRDHGKTILISSHLLYEIEQMATHMLIIHEGKKVAEGPVTSLFNPDEMMMEVTHGRDEGLTAAIQDSIYRDLVKDQNEHYFTIQLHPDKVPALAEWLVARGTPILQMQAKHSLETYFLSLTGQHMLTHATVTN